MTRGRYVVIVTGSRHDSPSADFIVGWSLSRYPLGTIVYEGECPYGGVDRSARRACEHLGLQVEPVPALTGESFLARNTRMVNAAAAKADELNAHLVCEAFPGPKSKGTWDALKKAVSKGARGFVAQVDK